MATTEWSLEPPGRGWVRSRFDRGGHLRKPASSVYAALPPTEKFRQALALAVGRVAFAIISNVVITVANTIDEHHLPGVLPARPMGPSRLAASGARARSEAGR